MDMDRPDDSSLFRPPDNCWRVARADQVGLLVDGEEFFSAFEQAALEARDTIIIIAWDFDSRTSLGFGPDGQATATVGDFLNRWVRRRRNRRVYLLIWDYPLLYSFDRELPPIYGLGWKPSRRIHIHYDNTIPIGASHHQKIIVLDDRVAFSGGLDLTSRRWDTCAHKADESRRTAEGKPYPPFHDAVMAVSGAAARALGDLAAERWQAATGAAPPRSRSARRQQPAAKSWPAEVPVAVADVDIAISRTAPATPSTPAIQEVEAMYLDLIRSAQRTIYIENQYFTAHRLGNALAERLQEPDGPEIVVVSRLLSHGWLEALSMEQLRTALVCRLRGADRHQRFQLYYPHVTGLPEGHCLDVHSKVMIVDDAVLHLGSANFANRSMGFDTECDLTLEARSDPDRSAAIAQFRHRLVAEHLGVTIDAVAEAEHRHGSLIGAITALARPVESLGTDQRTLAVLEVAVDESGKLGGVLRLADPEDPVPFETLIQELRPVPALAPERGASWLVPVAALLVIAAVAAVWRWTPLASVANGEAVMALARQAADNPWTAPALVGGYVAATFVVFPRPLLTLFTVVIFGPWLGFALALIGVMAATWANYWVGRKLPRRFVRQLAGSSLNRVTELLRRRGIVAMTVLRLVPIAPFAVPGIVAGAVRLPLRDLMLGTLLGNAPGLFITSVLGDRLLAVIDRPTPTDYLLLAAVLAIAIIGAIGGRLSLARLQLPLRPNRR
jgi:phosphatidylserine/phosphatidylglycerophosphate/cardiolipin synthase-like enzyme/uncharacterized membrane protein YdjX (TVP38/TMEM64 family)